VLFLYGLSGATVQLLPLCLSFLTLAVFLWVEYFVAADPVIPLGVLRSRGILLSCLAQLGFLAARWAILFYGPIYVLAVRGLSPAVSGSVLIPTNAGYALGNIVCGVLHLRKGGSYALSCLVSILCSGVTLFCVSFVSTATSSAAVYVSLLVVNGVATGAALQYTLAHLLYVAPSSPKEQYTASSLFGTFRGFAGSFGTAIGGGFVKRRLQETLSTGFRHLDGGDGQSEARKQLISRLIGSPSLVFSGGLTDAERSVAVHGYEATLKDLYQAAALVCVLVLFIQAGTGRGESKAEPEPEPGLRRRREESREGGVARTSDLALGLQAIED
jgi:hypothetical protein